VKSKKLRRWGLVGLALVAALGVFFGRPASLWIRAWYLDRPTTEVLPPRFTDDASRLNRTQVFGVWQTPSETDVAERKLSQLLQWAKTEGLCVSIAGARHSMGGHTISPSGVVLDMLPFNRLELDEDRRILLAGSGARWSEIVPFLDSRGCSVAVMQSNNDFSVGGSISVNCHGWQHNSPPIASTVRAFRLMTADGEILQCSRDENKELFSLVLGGYGLFGVILDVELRVVDNERYRPEIEVLPADRYVSRFKERMNGSTDIGMVFGRVCVTPGEKTFLKEAMQTVFRKAPCKRDEIPPLKSIGYETIRREVYRAQIGSDAGKEIRWNTEKAVGERAAHRFFSRNQLQNEPSVIFREQNANRTDILHEYFISPEGVSSFLAQARRIIPRFPLDLMNVTIRNVLETRTLSCVTPIGSCSRS